MGGLHCPAPLQRQLALQALRERRDSQSLDPTVGERRARGELLRPLPAAPLDLAARHDLVDQTELPGPAGRYACIGEQQLLGEANSQEMRQEVREAPVGHRPESWKRGYEGRLLGGDPPVGRQREREAAPRRDPRKCRDDGLRHVNEFADRELLLARELVEQTGKLPSFTVPIHHRHVPAGAEG